MMRGFLAIALLACASCATSGEIAKVPHDALLLDGWERSPAPILESWLVLGPLSGAESLLAMELFPRAGEVQPGTGLIWREAEWEGRGVRTAGSSGDWVACTFINVPNETTARVNFSARGVTSARLDVNGSTIAAATHEVHLAGMACTLKAGWNRLVVLLSGATPAGEFYVQFLDATGEALLHVLDPSPSKAERDGYDRGIGADTPDALRRASRRAIRALDLAYGEFGKNTARAQLRLGRHDARIDAAEEFARWIALGGPASARAESYRKLAAAYGGFSPAGEEDAARLSRLRARLAEAEPYFSEGKGHTWHLLQEPRSQRELWRRFAWARTLLMELDEEVGEVLAAALR